MSSDIRHNILGVRINAINMAQALDIIGGWLDQREPHYVCVTPAHVIMDCCWNPSLKGVINGSGLTTPDGMSIVWLLRLNGYRHVQRVYGSDLMLGVCRISEGRGWRHFFYGGVPGVADTLVDRLVARFPRLQIAGTYTPPFRPPTDEEEDSILKLIQESRADVLWIGISSPRQEQWMADHIGKLDIPVLVGVGAAFDFLSGRKKQAPLWMQRSGLEWLFRLASEPQRLWKRYAQYPLFALLVLMQYLGITRYE
jgi:N-acetylglucosaminyldiphosphoundecaprenol N-acetyl-beta-D-mannosaminyltransferase